MQEFYIRKNSVNPVLRMECFMDGRYDFKRSLINDALQSADVTFTMKDTETGILKISKAEAEVVDAKTDGCEERYILQYKWDKRDTKKEGIYEGIFEITFGPISEDGIEFPSGNLIVPIQERLIINIY